MAGASNLPLALVVDDSSDDRREACAIIADNLGWRTTEAGTRLDVLRSLSTETPSVVLIDPKLPGGDGLDLIDCIRRNYPVVPIVLITASGNEQLALRALQRGAASYVPKGQFDVELADSLEQVVTAAQTTQKRRRLLSFLTRVELEFCIENDPALIPVLIAQIQDHLGSFNVCDQNALIRIGVAVEEAVLNGMYHGNLEVSSQLRQTDECKFHQLVEERRDLPPFADRRLLVNARLELDRAEFTITDNGPGFDPSRLPDPTDPANLDTVGGRGLLLIRTFMDEVRFNSKGNSITLVKLCTKGGTKGNSEGTCNANHS